MMRSLPSSGGAAWRNELESRTNTKARNGFFICWRWLDVQQCKTRARRCQRDEVNVELPTFNFQRSTSNVQLPTFNFQLPKKEPSPCPLPAYRERGEEGNILE